MSSTLCADRVEAVMWIAQVCCRPPSQPGGDKATIACGECASAAKAPCAGRTQKGVHAAGAGRVQCKLSLPGCTQIMVLQRQDRHYFMLSSTSHVVGLISSRSRTLDVCILADTAPFPSAPLAMLIAAKPPASPAPALTHRGAPLSWALMMTFNWPSGTCAR
jgi:hypothetical protein